MITSGKLLKYALLTLVGIVGVLLIGVAIANRQAHKRLNAKLGELRDRSEPVTVTDLTRQPLPPEDNALTYLRRAESDADAIVKEVSAAEDHYKYNGEGPPGPEVIAAMRAALDAFPKVLPLLVQAAEAPGYDAQIDFTEPRQELFEKFMKQPQLWRNAARVLNYHAQVAIASGQPDVAVQDCIHLLQLTRNFDRNPLMVSFQVSLAIRGLTIETAQQALRTGSVSAQVHNELEDELALHDLNQAFRHAMATERAYVLDSFVDMSAELRNGFTWFPSYPNDQVDYLDLLAEVLSLSDRPYSDVGDPSDLNMTSTGPFTRLLVPSIVATLDAKRRMQAQLRCLRILNAAIAADQAGTGERTLASLNLPAEATTDPYNGQPLHLKKTPLGWVVYSVGRKLTDDGGVNIGYQPDQNIGLAPYVPAAKPDAAESAAEPTPDPGS